MEWVKAAGPITVAAIIGGSTIWINYKQVGISKQQARTSEQQVHLNEQEVEINKSQRDIAAEKLRHDMFKKHYLIYAAYDILMYLVASSKGTSEGEITQAFMKEQEQLSRARFLLNSSTVTYLEKLHSRLLDVFKGSQIVDVPGFTQDQQMHNEQNAFSKINADRKTRISEDRRELLEQFEPYFK